MTSHSYLQTSGIRALLTSTWRLVNSFTEELSAFEAKVRIIVGPEFIEIEWDFSSAIDIVGAAVKLIPTDY
jgi:hypothetical protein